MEKTRIEIKDDNGLRYARVYVFDDSFITEKKNTDRTQLADNLELSWLEFDHTITVSEVTELLSQNDGDVLYILAEEAHSEDGYRYNGKQDNEINLTKKALANKVPLIDQEPETPQGGRNSTKEHNPGIEIGVEGNAKETRYIADILDQGDPHYVPILRKLKKPPDESGKPGSRKENGMRESKINTGQQKGDSLPKKSRLKKEQSETQINERKGSDQDTEVIKNSSKKKYSETDIKHQGNQLKKSWKILLGLNFHELYFLILLMVTNVAGISGRELVVPINTIAVIGGTVRFNCSSDFPEPVFWEKIPFGLSANEQKTIYFGKYGLNEEFVPRYSVSTSNNAHDLIITNVEMSDAGKYFCIDEGGLGDRFSAELVVTEALDCVEKIPQEGMMGENIFGIPQRSGILECSLKFRGNIEPILLWKRSGSDSTYTPSSKTYSSVIFSTIAISSTEMNGAVFTCQAVLPSDKVGSDFGTNTGLQWTSKQLVVKYARLENRRIETCPGSQANLICNVTCFYIVKLKTPGKCMCTAYYAVEGNIELNYTYVCEGESLGGDVIFSSKFDVLVAVVLTIICCAAVIIVLILAVVWKKSKKKKLDIEVTNKSKDPLCKDNPDETETPFA